MGFVLKLDKDFAAIADLQVGDGNQQAAVGTTIALLERGSRVMSAIHKRCYYSMRTEFRLLSKSICNILTTCISICSIWRRSFCKTYRF
jgi:hypothetical protein